ncbi:MAG TPA: carboxylating nicotinate-nucleotide diphosphorylase [Actinobacteria bacterium]|nr:carboxylating nicotinate-nucleotide diphosphorylase [Actinomycetota bacterium]
MLKEKELEEIIKRALEEDLGVDGDITTQAIFSEPKKVKGFVRCKDSGIIAGIEIAAKVFEMVDKFILFEAKAKDGDAVKNGEIIAELKGDISGILSAERVAINFLQHLSGIATLTSKFVKRAKPYAVDIYDTRKTTPGLRLIEKYAVTVGGGCNHRMGLYDAILIKDNHIAGVGSVGMAVELAREEFSDKKIEVEADNLEQVGEALGAGADIIMLDNMDDEMIKKAVEIVGGKAILEASGGMILERIEEVAKTGVDRISAGTITQAAKPLDISIGLVSDD